MKRMFVLILLLVSCIISFDGIKVTTEGKGRDFKEALENVFQDAVRKTSKILIIGEQNFFLCLIPHSGLPARASSQR